MKNELCERLNIEFPLFAFSHCRDVVAAVSRAGGFGVLGATGHTPESIDVELQWIDDHVGGKPYGLDVLIPENLPTRGESGHTRASLGERISEEHREFVGALLRRNGINLPADQWAGRADAAPPFDPDLALRTLEAAFNHPIKMIANALGVPPPMMIEMGRAHDVPVAALVGAKEHAVRQVHAGVDVIVAQGGEAGGHCGEVSTLVLVPEVIKAVKAIRDVPVLAAGGIMTGRQMAGCMAMGAAGVWTGSVWLATNESETTQTFRDKMVAATSRDTIRSKARTGKHSRQLRSAWHDEWALPSSPETLPMPYQNIISEPALSAIDKAAENGNLNARELVTYFVGQGVGLIDSVKSASAVVQEFKEDFAAAMEDMIALVEA